VRNLQGKKVRGKGSGRFGENAGRDRPPAKLKTGPLSSVMKFVETRDRSTEKRTTAKKDVKVQGGSMTNGAGKKNKFFL